MTLSIQAAMLKAALRVTTYSVHKTVDRHDLFSVSAVCHTSCLTNLPLRNASKSTRMLVSMIASRKQS